MDKLLHVEEERARKKIQTIQTQKLNKQLSAEISCSSTVAVAENDDDSDINADDKTEAIQDKLHEDDKKLHEKYKGDVELTAQERKRMCYGPSGILDLCTRSYRHQRFTCKVEKQWEITAK